MLICLESGRCADFFQRGLSGSINIEDFVHTSQFEDFSHLWMQATNGKVWSVLLCLLQADKRAKPLRTNKIQLLLIDDL